MMTTPKDPPAYRRPRDLDARATPLRQIAWGAELFGWNIVWSMFKARSLEDASDFGGWLLQKIGPMTSAHKVALRNLEIAFPDMHRDEREAIAMQSWDSLGRTSGEMPHLASMPVYGPDARANVFNPERLDAVRESGRGAVFVSGHFSNWEVMVSAICNRPLDCLITYRAANNPYIDRRITDARHAYGIKVLAPKGDGTRDIMNALSTGRSVALMNDQKFNEGVQVPFFGLTAMTAPGPTKMALKYDVPLIPMTVRRTGPGRYDIFVHEPIDFDRTLPRREAILDGVTRLTAFIEDEVRANPGQWFWQHKRFDKAIYR
jgi:KDO2-lipid IV(A) lauroyltransferase